MGKRPINKMPREQRAKQFAPFQSVGGLYEALKRAEEEHCKEIEARGVINVALDEDGTEVDVTNV